MLTNLSKGQWKSKEKRGVSSRPPWPPFLNSVFLGLGGAKQQKMKKCFTKIAVSGSKRQHCFLWSLWSKHTHLRRRTRPYGRWRRKQNESEPGQGIGEAPGRQPASCIEKRQVRMPCTWRAGVMTLTVYSSRWAQDVQSWLGGTCHWICGEQSQQVPFVTIFILN